MAIIKRLDDHLANMIAAGEVVERPQSVVKELVENAIDAKATVIEVNLLDSGIKKIEVIDNGVGMDKDDCKMAFTRHATSKISNQHDLYRIHTLGFRGEAIPSIASVSIMTLKTSMGNEGYFCKYKGGKLIEEGYLALNKGTTVLVENLFYNTPARLKFIKSLNVELAITAELMDKFALANPAISFKLTNNKKVMLETNGFNDMISIVGQIYGLETARNLFYCENEENQIFVKTYLVAPFISKAKKNYITLIVNNRFVRNQNIINGVIDGYKTYLPVGRYPIAIVNITIDPLLIDVNVHPQKAEIKFSDELELRNFITRIVDKSFTKEVNFIQEIKEEKPKVVAEEIQIFDYVEEEPKKVIERATSEVSSFFEEKENPFFKEAVEVTKELPIQKLPYLEYIGQFLGTYLLFQNEEGLFIMDQHAAAERIRYEYYYEHLGNTTKASQSLLIPITLELTKANMLYLDEHKDVLEDIGFVFEKASENSIDISAVPLFIIDTEIEDVTEKMINYLVEMNSLSISKIRDSLAKQISCKGAIKANKSLNKDEVKALLDNLSKVKNPYTCPHGRPTIVKFTNYEIEKMFKRIM